MLVGVDGELLSPESYERLMRRVQDWTDVPEGLTGPPPLPPPPPVGEALAAEAEAGGQRDGGEAMVEPAAAASLLSDVHGEREAVAAAPQSPPEGEEEEEAFVDAREEERDSPSPPPHPASSSARLPLPLPKSEEAVALAVASLPSLLLTFRLADAKHEPGLGGMDYQDVFPLPVDAVQGGRPKEGDDEEALAHERIVASFRALLRAEAEAELLNARAAARALQQQQQSPPPPQQQQQQVDDVASSQQAQQHPAGQDEPSAPSSSEAQGPEKKNEATAASRPADEEGEEEAPPAVVLPPDRLLEHFLVLADWDVCRALAEYEGCRDEAQELLAAHEAEREQDEGEEEEEEEEDGPRLVWDPATEEPPGLEEFPLFEADPFFTSAAAAAAPYPSPPPSSEDGEEGGSARESQTPSPLGGAGAGNSSRAEFDVVITEQQRLGITVENVLERTVVCAVAKASCAFRAGMEEGCLIVALGEISARSMCHKEVVDRLQLMHRPLRVRLRRLAPEKLQQRRAEMIALLHPHGLGAGGSPPGGFGGAGGGGGGGGGAGAAPLGVVKEASLEARTQVVHWAEQKLLSLVRLLAVGSLRLEQQQQQGAVTAGSLASAAMVVDRPALWQERVLDAAALLQVDLRRMRARGAQGGLLGLNERLRALAHQLQALVDLFAEFEWAHPVLAPLRWHFLDLCCQLLCADADGALAVSRDARELSEGPAVVLLQETVARLRRTQIRHNTLMLLYRLAGSPTTHARVAGCALSPCLYARLPLHQQLQVRGILLRCLGEDSPPLVRAVVVEALSELAELMDAHSLKWLFTMLELAAKDGSPRVRNKLLEICFRVAQSLHRATRAYADRPLVLQELHLSRCKLLPFVNGAAEDGDWQVRAAFAYFCPGFVETFGAHWSAVFIDNLEGLMRDSEVMVRKLACDSIPKIAEGWLLPYPTYQPPAPPLLEQQPQQEGAPVPAPPPPAAAAAEAMATEAAAAAGGNGLPPPLQQQQQQEVKGSASGSGSGGPAAARCGSWSWGEGMDPRTISLKKQRIVDHLLPGFLRLVADPSVEVRASVAAATGRLLHLLTRRYSPQDEEAALDAALDGRVVQVMTPLMQRILHDEAPVPVALALLQGMRMEERVLYEGVGVEGENDDDGDDGDDEEELGFEADEEEEEEEGAAAGASAPDTAAAAAAAAAVLDTGATTTSSSTTNGHHSHHHHHDHKEEDTRDFAVAARGGAIPLPLVESQVELLLPLVTLLAAHPAWRLRQAVAEALPPFQLLCLHPNHARPAQEQAVWDIWVALLRDGVEIVRRAAGAQLCLVGRLLGRYPEHGGGRGQRWLEERVLPCVAECVAARAFKQRQLGLHMAEIVLRERCLARPGGTRAEVEAVVERAVLPLLVAGLQDPLANVRLVAAASLEHCGRRLPEHTRASEGTVLLRELAHLCQTDTDRDVRFFAARACLALGFDPPPPPASAPASASSVAASAAGPFEEGEEGGGGGKGPGGDNQES